MALVTKFEHETKERNSVHGPVECTYSVFAAPDGKRYLQLDTFGSKDRQIVGKTSQTIQLDVTAAAALKCIIEEEML